MVKTIWLVLFSLVAVESRASTPQPFLWGVANAAFQVEGAPADSDWLRFTHTSGAIKDGSNADVATDFLHRYTEDFGLAAALGANAFRISIPWERIQPAKNRWDENALEFYAGMIQQMRAKGLEPVVTLHHFTLPGWLADEGGLLAPDFPRYFVDYALRVTNRLTGEPARVTSWITFNEPEILTFCGYFWGCWPPKAYLSDKKTGQAMANLLRAHLRFVVAARATPALSAMKISIAKHWALIQPASDRSADRTAAELYDGIFNRQIMNALMTGRIQIRMPGGFKVDEEVALGGRPALDFLGINYYQRSIVSHLITYPHYFSRTGPGPKNDLGWEIFPEGLYLTLKDVARYKLPILITENGLADRTDANRAQFLRDHLAAMKRAMKEGVPVLGYLHWSLTDNFEWADGLTPRFGLVEIDYRTLQRRPRPSYFVYRDLIQADRDMCGQCIFETEARFSGDALPFAGDRR